MLEASTWLNEACLLIVMMALHALFSPKDSEHHLMKI
jgi:hypothetical protein